MRLSLGFVLLVACLLFAAAEQQASSELDAKSQKPPVEVPAKSAGVTNTAGVSKSSQLPRPLRAGLPEAAAAAAKESLDAYEQCGGKSNCEGGGKVCDDKAWPGFNCGGGTKCTRNDDYYWNCQGPSNNNNQGQQGQSNSEPIKSSRPQPNVALKVEGDGDYDYGVPLKLSNFFYRAQRSGWLPKDNGVFWRSSSGKTDNYEGQDVTGGWYDAGDNVKFNLPMAWTSTVMAWGVYEFEDGYKRTGALDDTLDNIKWATDYFLKCIIDDTTVVGQVGNGNQDHALWTRPEDVPAGPVYVITKDAPGSDLAGAMSAALTSAHMVFKKRNPEYATRLLAGAKRLYKFGKTYKGFYSTSIPDAGNFYRSSNYYDDLSFAACWLHMATGDDGYLKDAIEF